MPPAISSADVELLEATVWADLHGRFSLRRGEDVATVERRGAATLLASRAANAVAINRAIGFGFERKLDGAELSEIRQFYRQQRKARWFIECSPDADIDHAALIAAGGVIGGFQVKLVASLADLPDHPSPQLPVTKAVPSDAERFMDIVGTQLGVPEQVREGIVSTIGEAGWHFYFAMADSRPVAGAAMFVRGGGAWCGLAATLPEFRNRGAQSALLVHRIWGARAAGCQWISAEAFPETTAPNPSLRNMTRLGWRELYHRPWYRFQEDASRPSA